MQPRTDASEHNPAASRRFAELDGLRGLAALMVVLAHYVLAFQPALLGGGERVAHFPAAVALGRTPLIVLYNPELGVTIFFVLSGFVLAASASETDATLLERIVRRWFRLGLPILGTCLLVWPLAEWRLFSAVEAAPLAKSDWLAMNYAWLAFESNDLPRLVWQSLADIFLRGRNFYNTALWTMPIEFWGSLGVFLFYAALDAEWIRRGGGLAMAVALLAFAWNTNYFGFPAGVALFEARCLYLRFGAARRAPHAASAAGVVLLLAGVVLGGMPYSIELQASTPYAWLFLALGPYVAVPVTLMHRVAAVALVASALLSRPFASLLCHPILQFLGRISFMLYLCHVPILCSVIAGLLLRLAPPIGYDAATALLLPVFLLMVLVIAEATTRAIDRPALRLAHAAGRAAEARTRFALAAFKAAPHRAAWGE